MNSSSLLFGRVATIQVADILIPTGGPTGLDVRFDVKRKTKVTQGTLKPQPNTCDLTVLNLNPDHRGELESVSPSSVVPVVISAGYQARQSVIFSGELRSAHSRKKGSAWVTELTTGDGDKALTQSRIALSFGPGSSAQQVLQALVTALGVGPGNLQRAIALLKASPLAAQLCTNGVTLYGPAADLMTNFCRSAGLDWSVQNGALQVTELGQPVQGQAVLLDSEHGLLESPSVDTKGILSCRTEMIPDVFPGTALSMNAESVKGGYRVLSVRTKGDTTTAEWGHWIEAQKY